MSDTDPLARFVKEAQARCNAEVADEDPSTRTCPKDLAKALAVIGILAEGLQWICDKAPEKYIAMRQAADALQKAREIVGER